METIKNQIKNYKKNLSESSLKLYIGKLKRFKTKDTFDIKIFNNTDVIFTHLDEYPNISTKKSLLTAIVVALQSQPKINKKLIEKYQEEMMKYLNQEQSQVFKQEKSDKQQKNWITMQDFVETINKVHKEIKEKKIMKKKELNNTEYQLLQDYIILRLYHEYPLRNDVASLHVINDEKKLEENKNYLVVGDKYKIILQQYKTFKRYGKKEYILDKNLQRLVSKLLKHNTSGFLLLNKNRKSKLTRNNLTLHLNRIFIKYTGKKIGSSLLRHIHSSELNKDKPTLQQQQENENNIQNKFLHSGMMNQLYRKVD
jgi:hypothetical protein